MKKLLSIFAIGVLAFVGIVAAVPVRAQEAETTSEPTATPVTTSEQVVEGTYDYVAQPGDAYSVLARKSVQIYGIETQTNLTGAQIIFVETNITLANGSPFLNEGQQVSVQKSQVAEWVEKAKSLTDEEKAAWEYYVPFTDFNTDSAGEARS